MSVDLKKMKNFLFISPVSDFNTTIENDFIHEYMTTLNPFEIETIAEVPEANTNGGDGLFMIIYGIGGLLIFLVLWTTCYRCLMPTVSDDRFERIARRDLENIRARAEVSAGTNTHENIEVSTENIEENQVPERYQTIRRNYGNRRAVSQDSGRLRETSIPLNSSTQNEGRFFPQRLQNLFRPNTIAKQVRESRQVRNQQDSCGATDREQVDSQIYINQQQDEVTKQTPECSGDALRSEAVPKDMRQHSTDQELNKRENKLTDLESAAGLLPTVERRSRSSPTSPDAVRRRFSSVEPKPRLSSSWR